MSASRKIFAGLYLLSAVFLVNGASAQGSGAIGQQTGMLKASYYIGHWVWSSDGKNLGQISNLVIDKANERVVLAVLSDVPGLGMKVVPIPFTSVTRIEKRLSISNYGLNETWLRILNADTYLDELKRDPSLVGLPAVIDPEWVYQIYLRYDQVPYWKEVGKNEKSLSGEQLYSLNQLLKSRTQSAQGKTETQISDVIIDPSDGRVTLLVLNHISGPANTRIAVPFDALAMKDDNTFILNTTDQVLAKAPIFSGNEDKIDLQRVSDVYKYFGMQPYWTEQEQ